MSADTNGKQFFLFVLVEPVKSRLSRKMEDGSCDGGVWLMRGERRHPGGPSSIISTWSFRGTLYEGLKKNQTLTDAVTGSYITLKNDPLILTSLTTIPHGMKVSLQLISSADQ
ncbi:hypothetical protein HELRODRAFT_182966 [Helobdella robusta]|uniref:Uncharacterized protein n=1 Tax=Helobdella robusta TaxID=6412 RepID=T1FJ02_HELRO|nr:hypothetical protein HELRODRAFT_182966 [Helobdella robusta]ESN89957.1 hypothetical protein HELRODRAFT_182966 [Helobdella robusta]